jgi:hypothetical protein
LDDLQNLYGRVAVARLASFLTCSEFGLSETELLELLMPTANSAATLSLPSGNYNFSTLCAVRRRMSELHHLSGHLSLFLRSLLLPCFLLYIPLFIYLLPPLRSLFLAFMYRLEYVTSTEDEPPPKFRFCYAQILITYSALVLNM